MWPENMGLRRQTTDPGNEKIFTGHIPQEKIDYIQTIVTEQN